MAGYLSMKDELLWDAWLTVSADFVGRSRRGLFWQRVHDSFHAWKHIAPYDLHITHERNGKSLAYQGYTIQTTFVKFCSAVDWLEARWPLRVVAVKIVSFSPCSTCWLLHSFTQRCSTHCVTCTRSRDVPQIESKPCTHIHYRMKLKGSVCGTIWSVHGNLVEHLDNIVEFDLLLC